MIAMLTWKYKLIVAKAEPVRFVLWICTLLPCNLSGGKCFFIDCKVYKVNNEKLRTNWKKCNCWTINIRQKLVNLKKVFQVFTSEDRAQKPKEISELDWRNANNRRLKYATYTSIWSRSSHFVTTRIPTHFKDSTSAFVAVQQLTRLIQKRGVLINDESREHLTDGNYLSRPDVDTLVKASRRQVFAIGWKCDTVNGFSVFRQRVYAQTTLNVPKSDCWIERSAGKN